MCTRLVYVHASYRLEYTTNLHATAGNPSFPAGRVKRITERSGSQPRHSPVDVAVGVLGKLQSVPDVALGDAHVVAQERRHQVAVRVVPDQQVRIVAQPAGGSPSPQVSSCGAPLPYSSCIKRTRSTACYMQPGTFGSESSPPPLAGRMPLQLPCVAVAVAGSGIEHALAARRGARQADRQMVVPQRPGRTSGATCQDGRMLM